MKTNKIEIEFSQSINQVNQPSAGQIKSIYQSNQSTKSTINQINQINQVNPPDKPAGDQKMMLAFTFSIREISEVKDSEQVISKYTSFREGDL